MSVAMFIILCLFVAVILAIAGLIFWVIAQINLWFIRKMKKEWNT